MSNQKGHVYLLHFERPIHPSHPCQHYLGWTLDIDERLRQHRQGQGSRLCAVAKQKGISFRLAELLVGNRSLERHLKRQKNAPQFCPICQRSYLADATLPDAVHKGDVACLALELKPNP